MQYICKDCGEVTDEPVYRYDLEVGLGWYECPECHGDDMAEAEKCGLCGNYADKDDMTHTDDDKAFCLFCREKQRESFSRHITKFFQVNPPEVRDLINALWEGQNL